MKKTIRLLIAVAAVATLMLTVVYANSGFDFFAGPAQVMLDSETPMTLELEEFEPTNEEIQALEAQLQELLNQGTDQN